MPDAKQPRRFWTPAELEVLRERYAHTGTAELARDLDRTISSVYVAAGKLKLQKSPQLLRDNAASYLPAAGQAHRFQKAHVPHNKGVRMPGWAPGRMRETQFRPGYRGGQAAANWRPIGTILPDSEGYLRIKLRDAVHGKEPTGFGNRDVWPQLHRHVWEQAHGPVPFGHVICFKNHDRGNCSLDNLELVSRAELARRNRMWNTLPPELAAVIHLTGQLKRRIRNAKEKHDERSA